jgi:hypothetical protein
MQGLSSSQAHGSGPLQSSLFFRKRPSRNATFAASTHG